MGRRGDRGRSPHTSASAGGRPIRPQRVLITGTSGFIGGHLFRRFRQLGWHVVGVGRRKFDEPGYVAHDLAEPWPAALAGPFDVVVHAAARSSPWGSRRAFERDNVQATRHVLDHCRATGSPRLVFLSSSSVLYEDRHQLAMTEATPFAARPVNTYAATKQVAERLVGEYAGPWSILRPRAVVGPGDTVLLPRILRAAEAGRLPLLTSPEPVVGDLIYIDNLTDCVEKAATDPAVAGVFNLTNAEPVPILDWLLELFGRLGFPAPTRRVPVSRALWAAWLLEWTYALLPFLGEPPITRFGVHVFAYSKTFDARKMLAAMGPPRVSLREGLERIVEDLNGGTSPPGPLSEAERGSGPSPPSPLRRGGPGG